MELSNHGLSAPRKVAADVVLATQHLYADIIDNVAYLGARPKRHRFVDGPHKQRLDEVYRHPAACHNGLWTVDAVRAVGVADLAPSLPSMTA